MKRELQVSESRFHYRVYFSKTHPPIDLCQLEQNRVGGCRPSAPSELGSQILDHSTRE